jgi:hypothetical protein
VPTSIHLRPLWGALGDMSQLATRALLRIPLRDVYVGLRINRLNMTLPAASFNSGGLLDLLGL